MLVIEYQNRGSPQAHIVYSLHDPPDKVLKGDTDDVIERKVIDQARFIDGFTADNGAQHLPNISASGPGKGLKDDLTAD